MAFLRPGRPDDARDDETLAAEYRRGGGADQSALGQLYARYLELVYGLCLQYLRDGARAEDATMDIYEQLRGKLLRHEVERFRPWLYRLARNHCLMLLRKPASSLTLGSQSVDETRAAALDGVQLADIAHQGDSEDAYRREALLDALEHCRGQLPEGQSACIRRFYLEGASYAELAEELDLSLNRVRSHIQNGRRNLRNCLERHRSRHADT